jgi:pilus assembly protein CpaF
MLGDEGSATSEVLATLTGFGPLQPSLENPEVEEIWINEPTKVFVARNGITEMVDLPLSDTQVGDVVGRMLQTGRPELAGCECFSSVPYLTQ